MHVGPRIRNFFAWKQTWMLLRFPLTFKVLLNKTVQACKNGHLKWTAQFLRGKYKLFAKGKVLSVISVCFIHYWGLVISKIFF